MTAPAPITGTSADPFLRRGDLIRIVEKSAYLDERMRPPFRPADTPDDPAAAERRIDRWRKRVALGDESRFLRRLQWDGLSLGTVRRLAAGVQLEDRSILPAWADCLGAVLGRPGRPCPATLEDIEGSAPVPEAGQPVLFEQVLVPFADYATKSASRRAPDGWRMLSRAARAALQRDLLRRLSAVGQEALAVEFAVWRSMGPQHRAVRETAPGTACMRRAAYDSFVFEMRSGRLAEVLRRYPVLGRMLAERTCDWIAFTSEFLGRLETDHHLLSGLLGGEAGGVVRLTTGLSDLHDRGRSVLALEFENGMACVYKPRNMDGEQRFHSIVEAVNNSGAALPLRVFRVLPRGEYGWAEAIRRLDCGSDGEVRRHFIRAGVLLCLMFLLEGTDCHGHNLVAHGEFPTLVDMETLLSPSLDPAQLGEREDGAVALDHYWPSRTTFRCGILPIWTGGTDWHANMGALADPLIARDSAGGRCWDSDYPDAVRIHPRGGPSHDKPRPSSVFLDGREVSPSSYVAEIIHGFQSTYRALLDRHPALPGDLLRSLGEVWPRFLFRNTSVYSKVLERCRQVRCLSDGLDVTIEADVLSRRFLFAARKPLVWPLIKAEQSALACGDVPRFLFNPAGHSVCTGRGAPPLGDLRLRSGLERAEQHLQCLSAEELDLQTALIKLAFSPSAVPAEDASVPGLRGIAACSSGGDYLDEAIAIGRLLESSGVRTPGGRALWLSPMSQPESETWQLEPLALGLYDGSSGPGLFLAALERVTGAGFASMAMAAFKTLRDPETDPETRRFLNEAELGAGTGVGSVVYALARAGDLLGEQTLVRAGERIAASVEETRILQDRYYDVIRGTAGFLLSLLTLYSVLPRDWILQRATACGDHLLRRRSSAPGGFRTWRTIDGNILCGLSHGAAGIAYALRRLAKATACSRFGLAAREAESYEDSLYCESERNWPDVTAGAGPRTGPARNAWCHGAAGILLARLGASGDELQRPTELFRSALESLLRWPPAAVDHVCCGNGGRIETLLEAGSRMGETRFSEAAADKARAVIEMARRQHAYRLGRLSTVGVTSFHQGLAGIGYQWLRLHSPEQVPSVLLWA